MISHVRVVVILVLAVTTGCGGTDITEPPGTSVPLIRLRSDPFSFTYNSGMDDTEQIVVRDPLMWRAVWNQIYLRQFPVPPLPSVDFSQEMLVVAALGNRSTGGYSILLDSASETTSHGISVFVESTAPGQGCVVTEAFTQPVDIARLPLRNGPVSFVERDRVLNCY